MVADSDMRAANNDNDAKSNQSARKVAKHTIALVRVGVNNMRGTNGALDIGGEVVARLETSRGSLSVGVQV